MEVASDRLVLENNIPVKFLASPNHGAALQEKAFIVIHYTEGQSFQAAVSWLTSPSSQVSSHLVIGRNGEVAQLVPFNIIAWHAGASTWNSYSSLNQYSVGIELDNAGMMKRSGNQWISYFGKVYPDSEVLVAPHKAYPSVMYGWHKYTDIQLKTAAEVAAALVRIYGFREILGHDDIAPKRKWDPGPAFPMEQFRLDVATLANGGVVTPPPPPTPTPTPPPDPTPENNPPINITTHYRVENLDNGQSAEYTWSTAFKPMVLLPVPYISLLTTGAEASHLDCGAASASMLLKAYLNSQMTPDEFYASIAPAANSFLSAAQLSSKLGKLGVLTEIRTLLSIQDLFGALASGKPLVLSMRYKVFEQAGLTEKSFDGPHFGVLVGMDVKNVYIHDPLYTNQMSGEAHAYPLEIFWNAWKDVVNDPKYPGTERSAIIPVAAVGFKLTRKVKVNLTSLNVRSGPGMNFPAVGVVRKDEILELSRELSGWGQIGPNRWVMLA